MVAMKDWISFYPQKTLIPPKYPDMGQHIIPTIYVTVDGNQLKVQAV